MHALGHCQKYYILSKTEIRLQGEAVTRRKTDNTMTERNRENNDLQNINQRLRDTDPTKTSVNLEAMISNSCSTSVNCRATFGINPIASHG